MVRPKSKSGRTKPMSEMNGGDPTKEEPKFLVWDADNPPTVHACSYNDSVHDPGCDGNCADLPMDELDVGISNERMRWAQAGMNVLVVPIGFDPRTHANAMNVDLFDLEMQVEALKSIILEKVCEEDELNHRFKELILDRLTQVRELNEAKVREIQTRARLGLKPKGLLGPDGKPFS